MEVASRAKDTRRCIAYVEGGCRAIGGGKCI
jgi:hypothetical protein